jgi:hypothetical protein
VASPLDGHRQQSLVLSTHTGLSPGPDLAPFHDEAAQQIRLLIVNVFYLIDAELANARPAQIRAARTALDPSGTLTTA